MKKVITIVSMRIGSSRLPQKSILDLYNGKNSLDILWGQIGCLPFRVIIACPTSEENDVIANEAKRVGAGCFRGDEEDVLKRQVDCADFYEASAFVRITGDDLFIDPKFAMEMVSQHGDADFTFSNLPKGTESQVISTSFARDILEASANSSTEYWEKQRNNAWTDRKLNFIPLSPVEVSPSTFAIELDTLEDARVIRQTLMYFASIGLSQPYYVDDLARLNEIRKFSKSKDPVDRKYFR